MIHSVLNHVNDVLGEDLECILLSFTRVGGCIAECRLVCWRCETIDVVNVDLLWSLQGSVGVQ